MTAAVERQRDSLILALLLTFFLAPVGLIWTAGCFRRNWRVRDSSQWLLLLLIFAIFWTAFAVGSYTVVR